MAQEEIIFKLGVNTGDSVEKVSDVEEQFDILKKTISETEREVDDLTKQFGKNSQEVENARKKLGNLNASFNELKQASINVNSTFAQVYGELQPLTTRLGEAEDRLYELSLAGKQNTKEYKELLETVARYKQTQIETDRIVDQAALTMTQKLGAAIQGAANGFMVVQGASALFGDESKELEKALLKVQAAMALAQGIEGVRQALPLFTNFGNVIKTKVVTAFSTLKGAIMSTGIGALVVALGYLIANFDKLKGSMSTALTTAKNFETSTAKQAEEARKASDNFAEYERTLKRLGYTEEEINSKRKARYKDAIEKTQKEIEASKDVYKEQLKNLKIVEGFDKWGFNATGRLLFGDEEDAKAQQQKLKDLRANLEKLKNDQFEYNQKIKEDRKKDLEDQKKSQKDANDEAIRKAEERRQKLKEQREKELEDIRLNKIHQIELENARILEQETLENAYYDSLKTQQQLEEQAVRDKYFNILQTTKDNETLLLAQQKELDDIANKYKEEADKTESDRLNNIAQQYEDFVTQYTEAVNSASENEKLAVNDKYNYLIEKAKEYGFSTVELEKKRAEELKEIDKELLQAKEKFVDEVSNMLGTLANSSAEGSKIQKAFAVAQVAVDTAKSISSAIAGATAAAAAKGPAAPFLIGAYIASGIAAVTKAYSTVNKILKQPLPTTQAPNMNRPTDNAQGTNQQGTQQTIQAQSTYKVVVVDSDITKMQDKTKKVNAISTI